MRETKYRIWDKTCKKMVAVRSIDFDYVDEEGYLEEGHVTAGHRCDLLPFDEVELMQFTGVNDMDGISIYEGDICEDPYEGTLGVVKFSEGKFIIVWDNSGDDLFEVSDEVRVVGNIYEHGYFVRGLEAE